MVPFRHKPEIKSVEISYLRGRVWCCMKRWNEKCGSEWGVFKGSVVVWGGWRVSLLKSA